ncbi:hypothetical protein QQ045_007154 [Rhodiola kirilowii]
MSGRATLISAVLGSTSIHTLSILPVPNVVIKSIERLMRNFLWDRGNSSRHHWIKWETICTPKDEGGLGIRKLSDVKKCLLNKLAWRFLQNQSIWAQFARDKYLHSSYTSATWTALKPYISKMRRDTCWEIGKWDTLLSHFCEWLNVRLPKQAKLWTIKDVVNNERIKEKFRNMLSGVTRNVTDTFQLSNNPDKLCWRGAISGVFTTIAYYDQIRKSLPKNKLFKLSWQPWIPPKISVFLWRMWHHSLPTDDNIIKCGISMVSKCWCCRSPRREETEHLFIHSELARPAWNFLAYIFDKPVPEAMVHLQQVWFISLKKQIIWSV